MVMEQTVQRNELSETLTTGVLVLFKDPQEDSLEPARQALNSHKQWELDIRKNGQVFRQDVTLETLWKDIGSLRDKAEKSTAVIEPEHVTKGLLNAFHARRVLKERREQPTLVPSRWIQTWLVRFSEFLTNYSGIVEVVKAADQQYGGIAYGTLSLLLSIPVHKNQYESAVEDALEEFALAFPRLHTLHGTYPDRSETMKMLIAKVYAKVIDFARQCVIYYQSSSLGRLKGVIIRPPNTGIKVEINSIRQLLSQVRFESEVLLHRRIAELQELSQNAFNQVEALKKQINEKEKNEDENNLSILQSILHITDYSPHLDTIAYRKLLDHVFSDMELDFEDPCIMTWKKFTSEPIIERWVSTPGSCIVVLAGHNWESINNVTLSWVSYGSILAVEHFRKESIITAYYFCQTAPVVADQTRVTIQAVAASLLYQIARQAPHVLRSGLEDLRRTVACPEWNSSDDEEALQALHQSFVKFLRALKPRTRIVLILDRPDQCRFDKTSYQQWEYDLRPLMKWLLQIVSDTDCIIKVLVILHPHSCQDLLSDRQRRKLESDAVYSEKLDWDQTDDF